MLWLLALMVRCGLKSRSSREIGESSYMGSVIQLLY